MRLPISIIVIAHHNHITLTRCLDSIEQACLNIDQLILVGDDINQNVLAIFRSRSKWQIVRTDKKSPAGARNAGAKLAIHQYLAFFDDDSFVPKNWFEQMLAKMNESPWFVLGQSEIKFENENPTISKLKEEIKLNQNKFNPFKRKLQLGYFQFGLDSAAILVKKSWHDAITGFCEKFRVMEDTDYTLRTLFLGGDYFLTSNTHIVEIYNPRENISKLLKKFYISGKCIPHFSSRYCTNILINDYVKNTLFQRQSLLHFLASVHVIAGLVMSKRTWSPFPEVAPKASPNFKKSSIVGCSPFLRDIHWCDQIIKIEMDQI